MPIDYSKWDKIEISDDSDVEVHPNVDKKSFIKWKQRDIHEKRAQRNIEIKSILVQLTMYAKLNERVEYLLKELRPVQLLDRELVVSKLNSQFDPKEKFNYQELIKSKGDSLRKGLKDLQFGKEETENTPPYNEMIEDLFTQVQDDHPDAKTDGVKLVEYLKEHRAKIDDVLSKQTVKLDDLLHEKAQLIVSDDLHTGFDRSFMNKDKEEDDDGNARGGAPREAAAPKKNKTVTTTETLNSPSSASQNQQPAPSPQETKSDAELLAELNLDPATEQFGKLSTSDLSASANFLIKHTKICTEQQKDALMMSAFDAQLENNPQRAKQIIHQAIVLQYVVQLKGRNVSRDDTIRAIKLFFSKIESGEKLQQFFQEEFTNTVNHITQRCEIIKREQAERRAAEGGAAGDEEGEQLIQLRALDDNTTLSVNIPEEGTHEYEVFKTKLPVEFQEAIKTQSLDKVNEEFAKLNVEDAEKILEIFNECGAIGVNGYLENEDEFEELKKDYDKQEEALGHDHQHVDTNDEVD
ncbi:uncharacterized protein LODBEIA_P41220 [Lodderomyces beijingensis]|uniref:Hsp90 chaperone protein kinase-targeting subunit n=1 Tax=Lodderomyces beijingensis TaxID=1775926 RepID=A0ABP0ZP16_9ASCO